MTPFSNELITKLKESVLTTSGPRPRLLITAVEAQAARERARTTPGVIDILVKRARAASVCGSSALTTSPASP